MIRLLSGNLLESKAQALVNTVNTEGVMGKGIALQFKEAFPLNARLYVKACKEGKIGIGKLLVTREKSLYEGEKIIINFPTKTSWRKPSEYNYIEEGLKNLVSIIETERIQSVAIPPLGAGNGGLNWVQVKKLILRYLSDVKADILVYEPSEAVKEVLKSEKVKLTPARAMLLYVLYDLVANGELVSEFAAEKIAYFLQRFGAKKVFNLDFQPNFYGPYSGKVKHVLHYLNGSYVMGYNSKDKRPFEELSMVPGGIEEVISFLNQEENEEYKKISEKTIEFLTGFYSSYGLELLSTIDFIISEKKATSLEEITRYLHNWSSRKKTMFNNENFNSIATERIKAYLDIQG